MEIIVVILIILVISIIYMLYQNYGIVYMTETFCPKEEDTHALMAPNIPDDPKILYRIGGKYCKPLAEQGLAAKEGNYTFPIPKLLYDGVWESHEKIDKNYQLQRWCPIGDKFPTQSQYATNKFFHIPELTLEPGMIAKDTNVVWGDWNVLDIEDRNMDFLDRCDYDKHPTHRKGIMYWPSGIGCNDMNYI